jgi:acetyl-CoA carboxylase carboxyl transferase beta subunit
MPRLPGDDLRQGSPGVAWNLPKCNFHFYVPTQERIRQVLDEGTFEEWDANLRPTDPLEFKDQKAYRDRLVAEQKRTGLTDAVITGCGMIRARRVAFGVTDSAFIMGSMGSVVGESACTRLVERATAENLPLIIVSGSGGAPRMHEGILSLMQMAKVSAALAKYDAAGGLFISVLTDPDDGRSGRKLRVIGRCDLRRAQGIDRFRRPANDQGNDSHRVAQGLPNQRIPPGTRLHRSDRDSR